MNDFFIKMKVGLLMSINRAERIKVMCDRNQRGKGTMVGYCFIPQV